MKFINAVAAGIWAANAVMYATQGEWGFAGVAVLCGVLFGALSLSGERNIK